MSEQAATIEAFESVGLLTLFGWVGTTAYSRVAQEYDEDAGHDQSVVGFLGYKYCLDLFDRATSSGKYALPNGGSASRGRDLLRRGITNDAYEAMPALSPDLVNRRDFRGSPAWAWAWGGYRWALQSYRFGEVDKIVWGQQKREQAVHRAPALHHRRRDTVRLLRLRP